MPYEKRKKKILYQCLACMQVFDEDIGICVCGGSPVVPVEEGLQIPEEKQEEPYFERYKVRYESWLEKFLKRRKKLWEWG
jgi:hypothetical protein